MKWTVLLCLSCLAPVVPLRAFAEENAAAQAVRVSAEDAATRFVAALIDRSANGIRSASLRPYGPQLLREEYGSRLREFVTMVETMGLRASPPPGAPKRIVKVFAARPLSSGGPSSYGYAAFDFMDIVFVDVVVQRNDGQEASYRILVVQDLDGQWYAHPFPDLSPLLSTGLDNEVPSTVESKGFEAPKD